MDPWTCGSVTLWVVNRIPLMNVGERRCKPVDLCGSVDLCVVGCGQDIYHVVAGPVDLWT